MEYTRHPLDRLVWIGLGLMGLLLGLALLLTLAKARILENQPLPVYGQVADFTLTNQIGQAVSLADLRGHVWVADIIFTRCAGPCLKMTRQMKEIQAALPPAAETRLVTLTTDPEYDGPPVLKRYAERFGADSNRWLFLTGSKKQIAGLAIDSLKLTAIEKKPEERSTPQDLFIHSTIFVVIDKEGRLRGIYETTGEGIDAQQVHAQLLAAVQRLERAS